MTEASTKQQIQEADENELRALIAETIRAMNQRPGANSTETGEIVHRILKSARDIQGEKNGLLTKGQSFKLAIDRYNESVFAEAAAEERKAAADEKAASADSS